MREREREREERAQIGERERKKREPAIDEGRDRPTSEKREPAIDERCAHWTIAPLVDRDCEHDRPTSALVDRVARQMIAPISPSPRDLIFSSAARSQFDRI